MCLKLLNKDIAMPPLKKILEQNKLDEEDDTIFKNNVKVNYKIIEEKLIDINKKKSKYFENFKIYYQIIDDPKILWKMIYTKHIAGERPGMRSWSRSKYFADLLNFFKDGFDETNDYVNKMLTWQLQRDPSIILKDFKNAQFVREVIKAAYPKLDDKAILKKMIKLKISKYEPNFSVKHIRRSALDFGNIDKEDFKKRFFHYDYSNPKNLINLHEKDKDKEIHPTKILKFIFEQCFKGILTTRPVSYKNIDDFNLNVKILLNLSDLRDIKIGDINNKDDLIKFLNKINGFDYTLDKLYEMKKKCNQFKIIPPKRLCTIIDIKKIYEEIKMTTKKVRYTHKNGNIIEPLDVFNKLYEQLKHNTIKKPFFNAAATSIRSLLEQYLIWTAYYSDHIIGEFYKTHKKNSAPSIQDSKEFYIFAITQKQEKKELYLGKIVYFIRRILKEKESENEFIDKFMKETLSLENDSINQLEEIKKIIHGNFANDLMILNEFIHASHKVYNDEKYDMYLEKFAKWLYIFHNIWKNLNYAKLGIMNNEMLNKIE